MAQMPEESVNPQSQDHIDWPQYVEYLRGLAEITAEHGLGELELQDGAIKIHLKAAGSIEPVTLARAPQPVTSAAPTSAGPSKKSPQASKTDGLLPIVSPMVGVFYRQPQPGEPSFVEIGDRVEKGQTIGLVEAMKSFNEISAEVSGTVVEIPVTSGQLVETGQPLILLKGG